MTAKQIVLCTAVVLLAPAAARAQTAAHDWSGVYLGAHGGASSDRIHYLEPDDPSFAITPLVRGFVGGPLAGVARQRGHLVLGVEGEAGLGRLRRVADGVSGGNDYSQIDLNWNARVRGTVGRAMHRTLLFASGGLALGRVTLDDIDPDFGMDRATHTGWTFGGGLARAIGECVALRVEYLFDRYGTKAFSIDAPPGKYFPAYASEIDMKVHTLRGAVAFRF